MKPLSRSLAAVLLASGLAYGGVSPAGATVIRSVSAVIGNTLGERNAGVALAHAIDQSGLSAGYISGTTDFDAYLVGNPTHSFSALGQEWFAPDGVTSGLLTFDLGSVYAIDRVAIWNEDATGVSRLVVFTSNDPTFAVSTNVGTFSLTDNPRDVDYPADVLSLAVTSARYVRFEIFGAYSDPLNFIPATASLGEIAFSTDTVSVPEPATLGLSALGLLGLASSRRRR